MIDLGLWDLSAVRIVSSKQLKQFSINTAAKYPRTGARLRASPVLGGTVPARYYVLPTNMLFL